MKNLLQLIIRFHFLILFILIELFSLSLVIGYNNYQKTKFLNSSNAVIGNIYRSAYYFSDYFSLVKENEELAIENARLHNLLENYYIYSVGSFFSVTDSLHSQQYFYRWAKVINNSVNKQFNYITLNRGRKQGIKPEMAVINDEGIIGKVISVSDNFATVISLLNNRFNISAKIKKNSYYGPLRWDGIDYRQVYLHDIPFHVPVEKGDTIVTSGYSSIFPEGELIGTVSNVQYTPGDNFYNIAVNLSNDFKSLSYVHVIENLVKEERLELESEQVR